MPAQDKVTFYEGTQSQYNGLASKDDNGIYFLSDTQSIYKGDTLYGGGSGDVEIATPDSAGIIKPGSDFDIAADGTLTLYKKIDITSFSNSVNNVEKGSEVSSAVFSWAINKAPSTLTLKKGTENYTVSTSDRSKILAFNPPLTTNSTFTITATDARTASDSMNSSINFLNGRYWGIGTVTSADDINNAFVLGLTKELSSSRTKTFTVNAGAGQYIYYAIPSAFGTPSFFVGGFEGGFDLLKNFEFQNSEGYSESYNVYKSTNANLGNTTVEVK